MTDYRKMARHAAIKNGVDPDVFERQINQESGFNPSARSPAGASGIAQIMPATAKGWGVDPMNPEQALGAAARNMAQYVKKYGSYENALRAYNAGPGGIQASHGYAETNKYVANILGGKTPSTKGVGKDSSGQHSDAPADVSADSPVDSSPQFDQAGFQDAQRKALLARMMQSTGQDPKDNALLSLGLLSPGTPSRSDFMTSGGQTPDPSATGHPAKGGKTLVVGDSLGVGTAPYLEKDIGGVDADVKVGRPSGNAVSILRQKLAGGGKYGRIVFDVGTNDGSAQQLAQSIRQAQHLAPNAEIYVPTVNGPGAAQKNAVIRKMAGGNLHVVDWAGNSQGKVGGDGIHASGSGYRSRAELIADAMGGSSLGGSGSGGSGEVSGVSGRVNVPASANRPGVPMTKGILKLVGKLAGVSGHEINVGTGTQHSQMTTSGNVSDHWAGNAADIPSSGKALTRLGQQALVAYGMDPAKARQQTGGVYNLPYGKRRIQVLFNTTVGGNHYNHLHVGVSANR